MSAQPATGTPPRGTRGPRAGQTALPITPAAPGAEDPGPLPDTSAPALAALPTAVAELDCGVEEGDIPIGMELMCQNFAGHELMAGKVAEVRLPTGIELLLDNGWSWPVALKRLRLGQAEWVHDDRDYPEPGHDAAFDLAYRTTSEQRAKAASALAADREAEARVAAEKEAKAAREAEAAAHAASEAVASAKAPPKPTPVGVDATWRGPGYLADNWIRRSDGRELDMAQAGSRGWFRARTVDLHRAQFDIHT